MLNANGRAHDPTAQVVIDGKRVLSLERQLTGTRKYCEENNLILNETLNFNDLGISAFKGDNHGLGDLGKRLRGLGIMWVSDNFCLSKFTDLSILPCSHIMILHEARVSPHPGMQGKIRLLLPALAHGQFCPLGTPMKQRQRSRGFETEFRLKPRKTRAVVVPEPHAALLRR